MTGGTNNMPITELAVVWEEQSTPFFWEDLEPLSGKYRWL